VVAVVLDELRLVALDAELRAREERLERQRVALQRSTAAERREGRTEKLLASMVWYETGTFSRMKLIESSSVRFGCVVSAVTSELPASFSGRKLLRRARASAPRSASGGRKSGSGTH